MYQFPGGTGTVVKDPALSLLWLGSQLWCGFNTWLRELTHAMGMDPLPPPKKNRIASKIPFHFYSYL